MKINDTLKIEKHKNLGTHCHRNQEGGILHLYNNFYSVKLEITNNKPSRQNRLSLSYMDGVNQRFLSAYVKKAFLTEVYDFLRNFESLTLDEIKDFFLKKVSVNSFLFNC